jgi:hypothetical protein
MEEAGESRGRQGSYIDKTRNRQVPLLPPTTPLLPVRATRLRIELCLGRKTIQNHTLPFNYTGRMSRGNDVGLTRQRQQLNCSAISISIDYFITWPRCLLQLQPSSPSSTSILVANFIPRRLCDNLPKKILYYRLKPTHFGYFFETIRKLSLSRYMLTVRFSYLN